MVYTPCKPLITRPRWLRCARSIPATSRAVAHRLSAAPMIKAKNKITKNHGAHTTHKPARLATKGPPTRATRVPMRSSSTPAIIVPTNLPAANAVTIWAAPPADTPNCRAKTGIVGRIIAQAPEKNVPSVKSAETAHGGT